MTKIQIHAHDCQDGQLPEPCRGPVVDWLASHGLTYVGRFSIEDGRLRGRRYLSDERGKRYMWHADDHSPHDGRRCKDTDRPHEAAWEAFDTPLSEPPPILELALPPSAPVTLGEVQAMMDEVADRASDQDVAMLASRAAGKVAELRGVKP